MLVPVPTTVQSVCSDDSGNRRTAVTTIKFGMVMRTEHTPNTYKFITYIHVTFTFFTSFLCSYTKPDDDTFGPKHAAHW